MKLFKHALIMLALAAGLFVGMDFTAGDVDSTSACYLQSYNYPTHYIRHRRLLGELTKLRTALDWKDAHFRMVRGLANGNMVSFESINYPGHYLRHQGFRLKLHRYQNNNVFRSDATFRRVQGLANRHWTSFESYNYRGRYIRHRNLHLYVEAGRTVLFRKDATFKIHWR